MLWQTTRFLFLPHVFEREKHGQSWSLFGASQFSNVSSSWLVTSGFHNKISSLDLEVRWWKKMTNFASPWDRTFHFSLSSALVYNVWVVKNCVRFRWGEFFEKSRFQVPDATNYQERVKINIMYYQANYIVIGAIFMLYVWYFVCPVFRFIVLVACFCMVGLCVLFRWLCLFRSCLVVVCQPSSTLL